MGAKRENLKYATLLDIHGPLSMNKEIIFANSKGAVDDLRRLFEENKFTVSAIHRALEQRERNEIMTGFRTGKTRLLVSTYLLARGIDVQQITLVINFELPNDDEKHVHRIGRYRRKGVAINLCNRGEMDAIHRIEQ
jgi:translation initiation factor 4A